MTLRSNDVPNDVPNDAPNDLRDSSAPVSQNSDGVDPAGFDENADFSGIDGGRDLRISDVIHQANIEVDEQGTTAAAATGVVFHDLGVSGNVLSVDRPFLFFIRHDPTGSLLFAGRVTDPTK